MTAKNINSADMTFTAMIAEDIEPSLTVAPMNHAEVAALAFMDGKKAAILASGEVRELISFTHRETGNTTYGSESAGKEVEPVIEFGELLDEIEHDGTGEQNAREILSVMMGI